MDGPLASGFSDAAGAGEEPASGAMQQLQLQQQAVQQAAMRSAAFWQSQLQEITLIDPEQKDWNQPELPLARIKKIMKSEDEIRQELGGVKFNISAEAPVMFAKACEMFVLELTMNAWNHTEEGKRRTLQRNDIVNAVSNNDVYDFLIDIVPREQAKTAKTSGAKSADIADERRSSQYLMLQKQQEAAQEMMAQVQQEQAAGGMDVQQQMTMLQHQMAAAAANPQALQFQQMMWQKMMQQQSQYYQQLSDHTDGLAMAGFGLGTVAGEDGTPVPAAGGELTPEQQAQHAAIAAYTAAAAASEPHAAGGGAFQLDHADGTDQPDAPLPPPSVS